MKKVDDKNDSTNEEDNVVWQDLADYDIGDHVPFQLTGTLPDNFKEYNQYYNISYLFKTIWNPTTKNLRIVCENLAKLRREIAIDSLKFEIVVYYTATLDEEAVIGKEILMKGIIHLIINLCHHQDLSHQKKFHSHKKVDQKNLLLLQKLQNQKLVKHFQIR